MSYLTSEETILKLQHIFKRFRVTETLESHNGSAFILVIFSDFCLHTSIKYMCTSPYHPQLNGKIEPLMDTFERALQILKGEGMIFEILKTFLTSY